MLQLNRSSVDMNREELVRLWLREEEAARVHGWDFSHIKGRYKEEGKLPWDYEALIRQYLRPEMRLLDIDTGGGEFLLSLGHPCQNLAATENYPPNVELCREKLLPLGVEFCRADGGGELPFADNYFDMVINRHGDYCPDEIGRVLKEGGLFITQQVGAENDRELVELLLKEAPEPPFPQQYLRIAQAAFEKAGFSVIEAGEAFSSIKFWDVGALVWFARIIEWEFPGFQVKKCLENLYRAQEMLMRQGVIEGRTHRFLLVVRRNAK